MSLPLRALFLPSHEVSDELLREIWRLRLEMLTLTRSQEQDWEEFRPPSRSIRTRSTATGES